MTIRCGLGEPIITRWQRLVESLPMVVNFGERSFAYLRPHGRSEGKVKRYAPTEYNWPFTWATAGLIHTTRANAAKMANEDFIDSWNRMIRNPVL